MNPSKTSSPLAVALLLITLTSACGGDQNAEQNNATENNTPVVTIDMPDEMSDPDMASSNSDASPDMNTDVEPDPDEPAPPEGCEGVELSASGSLNLDMPRVVVQGTLTLNGAELPEPDDGFGAGSLVFTHVDGHAAAILSLDGETKTYEVGLIPGVYHIDYIGDPAACSKPDEPSIFPCNTGRLASDVALTQQGVLDLDIKTVSIQGTVSLNGEALPAIEDADLGVTFSNDSSVVRHALASDQDGRYRLTVVPGTYDIGWDGDEGQCASHKDPSEHPCNDGVLQKNLTLQQSGSLDVNVDSVLVNGAITSGGASIDDTDPTSAATLAWVSSESAVPVVTSAYVPGEQAVYSVHLLRGTYDVLWQGNPDYCADLGDDERLPCHTGTIASDLSLGVSGSLDFDLETVRIYGSMTIRGETPSDEHEASRGTVLLTDQDGHVVTLPFERANERLQYIANVLVGTYQPSWSGNPGLCADIEIDHDFPCNAGSFGEARGLNTSGELSFDVPSVKLTGQVTLDGQMLPEESDARGQLTFTSSSAGPATSAMFEKDGPANYRMVLLPGTYDISWTPNPALCTKNLEDATAVPCTPGVPAPQQPLQQDGSLPIDITAVTLAGTFTQAGEPLPEPTSSGRGNLVFQGLSAVGVLAMPPFEPEGDARYQVTVYPGSYLIAHQDDPTHCAHGSDAPQRINCGYKVVAGCQ